MSVRYDLDADASGLVDQVERAIATMKAAEERIESLEGEVDKLNTKLSSAGKKGAKDLDDGMKGLEKTAKTIGGPLGQVADTVFDLEEGFSKMAGALGPAGAAVAGVGVALAGIALVTVGLVGALASAVTGAVDLGRAAAAAEPKLRGFLQDDILDQAEELGSRLNALDLYTDALTVRFATLTPVVEDTVDGLIGAAIASDRLLEAFDRLAQTELAGRISEIGREMLRIGTLGASEAVMQTVEALIAEGASVEEVLRTVVKTSELAALAAAEAAAAERAAKEGATAAQKEVDKWIAKLEGLQGVIETAEADLLTPIEKVNVEYGKRLALIEKLGGAGALADEARAAAEERLHRDKLAIWAKEEIVDQAMWDAKVARLEKLGELTIAQLEAQGEAVEKANQQRAEGELEVARLTIGAVGDVADAGIAVAEQRVTALEAERERLEDLLANNKELSDYERGVAKAKLLDTNKQLEQQGQGIQRLVVVQKMAALSEIAVNTAVAITAALAQLGPIAGALAAGAITATGLTQATIVSSQPVPTFHSGSMGADEFMVGGSKVRDGEKGVVLNQRAVENGAVERVRQENTNPGRNGDREVRLVLADAGRTVGELVAREAGRPGSAVAGAFGTHGTGTSDPYGGR